MAVKFWFGDQPKPAVPWKSVCTQAEYGATELLFETPMIGSFANAPMKMKNSPDIQGSNAAMQQLVDAYLTDKNCMCFIDWVGGPLWEVNTGKPVELSYMNQNAVEVAQVELKIGSLRVLIDAYAIEFRKKEWFKKMGWAVSVAEDELCVDEGCSEYGTPHTHGVVKVKG